MKRPSCKWKGQTVADDQSTGGAGSPISRMPQHKLKAGYVQDASPTQTEFCQDKQNVRQTKQKVSTMPAQFEHKDALTYLMEELSNRSQSTRDNYLADFLKFSKYTGMTADQLIPVILMNICGKTSFYRIRWALKQPEPAKERATKNTLEQHQTRQF